ncbi:helix-turn-helix domain-containing protein [Nocardiopsis metallicus]|uniref:Transcriptional regulator with XRE-family HTH domain n=1 Tax=Nocardiopsis metallicus TaxID=179819 RepID=A0A840WFU6_9ACTN|nr:DUF5753 domain-containing protein [Nocardiopsis metallicus]MBB5490825.1 transcriptional regulator with XRE-family HTH domain [Nocardiopsis metallicus]
MVGGRGIRAVDSGGTLDHWEGFGARVWAARREHDFSLDYLAAQVYVTSEMLQEIETGALDPGRRVAQDLDRNLYLDGELWDAWGSAHLATLFQDRVTITDVLPEAFQVRAYAPLVLPEPYLTDAYATALHRAERPMESLLLDDDRPHVGRLLPTSGAAPHHCLVIDETALTRTLADADTTRAQLLHLHRLAQSDRITVHIIPTGTPYHPGLRGAFWTLSFSPAHTLVYSPHARGPGHVISEPALVKGYTDLYATLQGVALSADDSLHRVTEIAARVPTPERRALHP